MDQAITCPQCGTAIELSDAVAGPILDQMKEQFQGQLKQEREQKDQLKQLLEDQKKRAQQTVAQLNAEKEAQIAQAKRQAQAELRESLRQELEADQKAASEAKERRIQELLNRVSAVTQAQAEAEKAKMEMELRLQTMEIEVAKKVTERLELVRTEAKSAAEEEAKLRVKELEEKLKSTSEKLAEAQKRAEQGSQQTQGEVLELDLQWSLSQAFATDVFEEVKKGQRGGDILQKVQNQSGGTAGVIMWESKRTLNWGGDWCDKAKQDARAAGAEAAVIVSEALPKGITTFGEHEGVWVSAPRYAVMLAQVLRRGLLDVAQARRMAAGRQTKAEVVYDYLTGPEFKARIEGISEPFVKMRDDLDKERNALMKHWARREKQISRVLENVMGMYGDLQGLAGADLAELEGGSALGALAAAEDDED